MVRIQVVDAAALATTGAELIAQVIREALDARGRASLALSGGRTPEPVYRHLAAARTVPWDRVEIFFGDERAVPPHDERSNYRMAWDALLAHVPIPGSAIHRIEAERADVEQSVAEYAALLPDRLDLILLDIGADGHTASLFPHATAIEESARKVLSTSAPTLPDRITITPPVLAGARETLVIAAGARKAETVRRALVDDVTPADCPARLVRDGMWLLDREAAARLGRRS